MKCSLWLFSFWTINVRFLDKEMLWWLLPSISPGVQEWKLRPSRLGRESWPSRMVTNSVGGSSQSDNVRRGRRPSESDEWLTRKETVRRRDTNPLAGADWQIGRSLAPISSSGRRKVHDVLAPSLLNPPDTVLMTDDRLPDSGSAGCSRDISSPMMKLGLINSSGSSADGSVTISIWCDLSPGDGGGLVAPDTCRSSREWEPDDFPLDFDDNLNEDGPSCPKIRRNRDWVDPLLTGELLPPDGNQWLYDKESTGPPSGRVGACDGVSESSGPRITWIRPIDPTGDLELVDIVFRALRAACWECCWAAADPEELVVGPEECRVAS